MNGSKSENMCIMADGLKGGQDRRNMPVLPLRVFMFPCLFSSGQICCAFSFLRGLSFRFFSKKVPIAVHKRSVKKTSLPDKGAFSL